MQYLGILICCDIFKNFKDLINIKNKFILHVISQIINALLFHMCIHLKKRFQFLINVLIIRVVYRIISYLILLKKY